MRYLWILLLPFPFLIHSCTEPEEPIMPPQGISFNTQNLLQNGSFELSVINSLNTAITGDSIPQMWNALTGPTYETRMVKDSALDGQKAVSITSNWVDPAALAYLYQDVSISQAGKKVRLVAKIRSEEVEGEGLGLEIQGFANGNKDTPIYVQKLEDTTPIKGSRGWTEFSLTTTSLDPSVSTIRIFIKMLRSTTGRAYFDQIELFVEE
ncbi:MAG: hypothetical protein MRZ79_00470 [Bacteroidia bacterium]|nr:hypothetical protein [Bacteroidia bacterium]